MAVIGPLSFALLRLLIEFHPMSSRQGAKTGNTGFDALAAEIHACRRCPRLVEWREAEAAEPPRRYRGEDYWARPLDGFGDPDARLVIVGLAPAAHGANRTGRMFTGDRSGEWLYAALHRAGYANRPESNRRGDGLRLHDAYITAVVRCAPPANRPLPEERDNCLPYLERELELLPSAAARSSPSAPSPGTGSLRAIAAPAAQLPRPQAEVRPRRRGSGRRRWTLLGCYHPSQQNTFTGRLTEAMLDAVFARAGAAARG